VIVVSHPPHKLAHLVCHISVSQKIYNGIVCTTIILKKDKIDTVVSTFVLLAVGGSILNDDTIQELVPVFLYA
jgi:hypothetical protein